MTEQEAAELALEIADRYGALPSELENYVTVMKIRALCRQARLNEIEQKNTVLLLRPTKDSKIKVEKVLALCAAEPKHYKLNPNASITIQLTTGATENLNEFYKTFREFLKNIC